MVWGIPLYLPQNNSICPDLPPFASQPNPVSGLMAEGCSEVCPELDLMYNCRRNKCLSSVHSLARTVLTIQGERRFSLLRASNRRMKTKALLAPTASIPRTTPDQSLVSMAAGELGSAVHGHSYRPTQHEAWLALHKSMETEATDKLHYCQSWYNAQASTSAWKFRWHGKLKSFSTSSQGILGWGTEHPVAALFQSEVTFSFSL